MGLDPRQLAMARQALQSPNAGDGFSNPNGANSEEMVNPLMPGTPADMLAGGVVGTGIGLGMNYLSQKGSTVQAAKFIDKLPGISKLSAWLDQKVLKNPSFNEKAWVKEMTLAHARGAASPEAAVKAAMAQMEARHIGMVLKPFEKNPEIIKRLGGHTSFEKFMEAATREVGTLAKGTKAEQKLAKTIRGLGQQIKGKNNLYSPLFRDQARLVHLLEKEGVGPIGRSAAMGMNYLHRIFGGEMLKDSMSFMKKGGNASAAAAASVTPGAQAAVNATEKGLIGGSKGLFGKLFGPFLAGAMIIGQSFAKAKKAPEGEKGRTFFHDFIGTGIGQFIGWEFGRKVLNSFGIVPKLLGGAARKLPFGFLSKVPLLKVISGVTLGGVVTEMLAMFVIAGLFQKVFEGISHKIFGTPSKDALEGGKGKPAQQLPSSTNGQPLSRKSRYNSLFSPASAQAGLPNTHGQAAVTGNFTLTPSQISTSMAAQRSQQNESQVLGSNWNEHNFFNPFGH